MKTMLVLSIYMVCFEHDERNTAINLSFALSPIFFVFLRVLPFLSLAMSDTIRLSSRQRILAAKLQDSNNAAEPEIRMHQRDAPPQSVAPGDHDTPPHSCNDAPETSSNANNSREPGTQTVLGV